MKKLLFVSILIFCVGSFSGTSQAAISQPQKTDTIYIYLKDFGLVKTRERDCTEIISNALKTVDDTKPAKIIFNRGEYHFYPEFSNKRPYYESNTTDINPRNCALVFENRNNLVIEGNGSTLIFHEQMQPFTFDGCSNIVLKNINIDWKQPQIAQARVISADDRKIRISMDVKEFPFRIEDGKILFGTSKDNLQLWKSTMEFDATGRFVVPQTGDNGCLGKDWGNYQAENILPGIVDLKFPFLRKPAVGNYLVMRFAERIHSGIFIQNSKNIRIQNVNLYHATGLGALAQYSENITFSGYRAIPNKAKNRYFGGGDDGIQISNCRGLITIENCEFAGLMDDPVNVHGTSVKVLEVTGKQLKCKFMHHQSIGMTWGHAGDKIGFIENSSMQTIGTGEVANFKAIDKETFLLTLKTPVPAGFEPGDALENLTRSPDLKVANNRFGSCRARGLLVSTPGKVVIENNIFESSGSAILICGDANYWYESGAVTDVLIQNNTFTDLCNTSSYQFCEGIISVYPEIPEMNAKSGQFHRNISITGNTFHPFDYPVLYAKSVDGINFNNNKLIKSNRFEPYHNRKYTFTFEGCKNIGIENNIFEGEILGKNVLLKHTPAVELKYSTDQNLSVKVD